MGELPLRGAARWGDGGGSTWGSFRCEGLLDGGWRRLQMGELPLRGAARWGDGGGSTWGSFRCAGLLDGGVEEAAHGGASAVRGCLMGGWSRLLLLGYLWSILNPMALRAGRLCSFPLCVPWVPGSVQ